MVTNPYSSVVNGWKTGSRGCPFGAAPLHQRQQISVKSNDFQGISMARQFVYFMQGLTKSYPTRKVLDNVHLSFYPDAKIGVLGVNGSGKSTLLRIMAGLDKEYNGEAWVAEGARVGYLEQEPQLDPRQVGPRERHAGRRQAEGDPRSLQRTGDELFGRDRRRDDQAAGRDRGRRASGISTARSTRRWTRCAARPTMPT